MSIKRLFGAGNQPIKPIIKIGFGSMTIIEHLPVPDNSGNLLRTTTTVQGNNKTIVRVIIDPAGKVIVDDPKVIDAVMSNTKFNAVVGEVVSKKTENFTIPYEYNYQTIIIILLVLYILYMTFYKKK